MSKCYQVINLTDIDEKAKDILTIKDKIYENPIFLFYNRCIICLM